MSKIEVIEVSLYLHLSFFSLLSIAQEKATISGKISSNSEPVPFAFVYVQEGTQGTTANEEGSYQLEVPSGEMIITVSAQGYRKVSKKSIYNLVKNARLTLSYLKIFWDLMRLL